MLMNVEVEMVDVNKCAITLLVVTYVHAEQVIKEIQLHHMAA